MPRPISNEHQANEPRVRLRRGSPALSPTRFALVIAECVESWLGILLKAISYKAFYIEYWTLTSIITILGFAVLREVFLHIFRPYEALRNFGEDVAEVFTVLTVLAMPRMRRATAQQRRTPFRDPAAPPFRRPIPCPN